MAASASHHRTQTCKITSLSASNKITSTLVKTPADMSNICQLFLSPHSSQLILSFLRDTHHQLINIITTTTTTLEMVQCVCACVYLCTSGVCVCVPMHECCLCTWLRHWGIYKAVKTPPPACIVNGISVCVGMCVNGPGGTSGAHTTWRKGLFSCKFLARLQELWVQGSQCLLHKHPGSVRCT